MARHRTAAEKVLLGEQARALRAAGRSRREIMAELGIGEDLAKAFLRGTTVPEVLRRARAKPDQREAALALRAAGRTYDEIADELGVSKGSLSLWLRSLPHPTAEQRQQVHRPDTGLQSSGFPPVPHSGLPAAHSDGLSDRVECARDMRRTGALLREIAVEYSVSVKTACLWCTGLPVPERARHGGDREHVRAMARKRWDVVLAERDAERTSIKAATSAAVGALTHRELELIAVTAYWCEGSKDKIYDRREKVEFINSDPDLMRVWLTYLVRRGYGSDRWRLRLSIHESGDVSHATRFWAQVSGVDPAQFCRPTLKRHVPVTSRKNTGCEYVGCLIVRVLGGRALYQEIEGTWRGIAGGVLERGCTIVAS